MGSKSNKGYSVSAKDWVAPTNQTSLKACQTNRCLCCNAFDSSTSFTSFSTGGKFLFDKTGKFNCKTKNVIYLISCKKCGLQYVGQTTQALHCRLNGHRNSISKGNKSTFIINHFRNDSHTCNDMSIQIIDVIEDVNDKAALVQELNKQEDYYIRTLNTLHPLGLNDKLAGGRCVSKGTVDLSSYFNSPIPRRKRSHGIRVRKSSRNRNNNNDTLTKLKYFFDNKDLSKFYQCLRSLSFDTMRIIKQKLTNVSSEFAYIFSAYFYNKVISNESRKPAVQKTNIVFDFKNKIMDKVDISSILHDKSLNRLVPDKVREQYPPKTYFSLNNPVSLKICNYNKFLNKLDRSNLQNIVHSDCKCSQHPSHINEHHKHVFTGDLDFIEQPDLKELLSLGSKHRLSLPVRHNDVIDSITVSIDKHITKMCNKFKLSVSDFQAWKNRILVLAKDRIHKNKNVDNLQTKFKSFRNFSRDLKYYHQHFIITTVDKANSNYAFICKKFYVMVLLQELGFDLNSLTPIGNSTYIPYDVSPSDLVKRHKDSMSKLFSTLCRKDDEKLPKLYWIPKLHKNPFKFRFIAGARHCTTKQLSIKINKGLSVIRDHFRKYCNAIHSNSGINCYWSIVSSAEFLNKIQNIAAYDVQIFDFSTLYTNLDHKDVITHISDLLDLIFNDSNRKYLCVGFEKSFLSGVRYQGYSVFTKDKFKEAIKFIISEVFVTFGGLVFQQVRGIPMGGNCSPLLADLFLLHCEFIFMTNLMKNQKYGLARLLSNTSRYIDDLCIINYKKFDSLIPQIYPPSLEASRSGSNNKQVEYLDININITDCGTITSVFHKVDHFNFPVTLLTFPQNCMPYRTGARVFAGQVLRYGRICTLEKDFIQKVNRTATTLIKRGYNSVDLKQSAEKQLHKHSETLLKYGYFSAKQLLNNCACFH